MRLADQQIVVAVAGNVLNGASFTDVTSTLIVSVDC